MRIRTKCKKEAAVIQGFEPVVRSKKSNILGLANQQGEKFQIFKENERNYLTWYLILERASEQSSLKLLLLNFSMAIQK